MKKAFFTVFVFLFSTLAGCAFVPVEKLLLSGSVLTAGGESERFKRTSQTTFKKEDRVIFITYGSWEPVGTSAGWHKCEWRWYSGGKLVSKLEREVNMFEVPFEVWSTMPATALQTGQNKVELYIDGKLFDSKEFEVVP